MVPDSKRAKLSLLGSLIAASVIIKVSTASEHLENRIQLRTRKYTSGAGIPELVFTFA